MRPALSTIRCLLLLGLICLGVGAPSAGAITNGEPDTAHPMVGVLAADLQGDPAGLQFGCSGTLIAPTVFLTAGHCLVDLGGVEPSRVWVTFDDQVNPVWDAFPPRLTGGVWRSAVSYALHPAYRQNAIDAYNDVGIVRLTDPVTGIPTAHVADTVGYLDDLVFQGRRFRFAGYGINEVLDRYWFLGPPHAVWDGVRKIGYATFGALTPYFLRLQTNSAVDPTLSTPGPGDSGAPVFANVVGHDVAVALVSSGNDMMKNQRLDSPAVQSWLQDQLAAARRAARLRAR